MTRFADVGLCVCVYAYAGTSTWLRETAAHPAFCCKPRFPPPSTFVFKYACSCANAYICINVTTRTACARRALVLFAAGAVIIQHLSPFKVAMNGSVFERLLDAVLSR